MVRRPPRCAAAALVPLLSFAALPAQADRYELGLRLRAFERELAQTTAPEPRRAAFAAMNDAVQAFFGMNPRGVAEAVERATWRLRQSEPTAAQQFARSLQVQLSARLAATGDAALPFAVQAVYAVDRPELAAQIELSVAGVDAEPRWRAPLGELPLRAELPLRGLPAGDHTLRWRIRSGDQTLVEREQGLSLAKDLSARLAPLVARDDETRERTTLEAATERLLVRLLQSMQKQRLEETVYPGDRLLAECEALAALPAERTYYGPERSGPFWLQVPHGKSSTVVRVVVPARLAEAKEKVPLVLALHGAGGSENLFCDGYGDGAIVPLCAARGWFLCAPRVGGFGGLDLPSLVDALAARYPIDTGRVFVIGHSMGAMATVSSVMKAPDRFAAAAPISGGGGVRRSEALAKLPFFVAAGGADFGRGGSEQLHRQLQKAGAPSEYREYPDVEHLTVVQIALPDVFAFFDQHARR